MSRVGRSPIAVPGGVTVTVRSTEVVSVGEELSATEAVKDDTSTVFGAPVMDPDDESR